MTLPEPGARRRFARLCGLVGLVVAVATWLLWREAPLRRHLDLRFTASLVGVGLVLLSGLLPGDPASGRRPRDLLRRLFVLALSAWAGWSLAWTVGVEFDRLVARHDVDAWNHFHYYLGAKYFPELGYSGLYEQALATDAEGEGVWRTIPKVRDLARYEVLPTTPFAPTRSEAWSEARWQAFSRDVAAFQPQLDFDSWRRLFRDRGYNGTPPWTAIGRLLVRVDPTPAGLALLSVLDPLLLLAAFLVAARVFGGLRSAVAASFAALYFGNEQHLVGSLFQHDYVAALVLAACAVRTRRGATAGALIVYAAMMRIFPGFLVFGLGIWTVKRWRATGGIPAFTRRFALGFAAACLAGLLLGGLGGRGLSAWPEFIEAISLHSAEHRLGNKRIGLQHAFTHDWSLGLAKWEKKKEREVAWPQRRGMWAVAALLLAGLWAGVTWATAGEDPLEPMIGSLLLVFAGVVLSRYYWTAAALWILVGGHSRDGPFGGRGGTVVAAALLSWCALIYGFARWGGGPEYGGYVLANAAFGLGAAAILVGRSLGPVRRLLQLDGGDGGHLPADRSPALD